jgi:ubiquinol-cytochrome c reductase cytochrome b subunit
MGLQRRDRDKVLHGRESGLIKMLPHGEYVEVHEPLAPDERFRLTQHEQDPPYEIGPLVDANGVERQVKGGQRVRARLARAMFGSEAQIPKPTVEEYKELTSGDHH